MTIPNSVMENVVEKLRFSTKPITKKAACEMLGIAYNTARLDKLIGEFLEEKERKANKAKANKGKPASDYEITTIIEQYLDNEPISQIADRLCRSTTFVKNILIGCGIPIKDANASYFNPQLLPLEMLQETLLEGSIVFSARHQEIGTVKRIAKTAEGTAYWVYLASEQNVALMWYDILPLDGLIKKYSLKLHTSSGLNAREILSQTLIKAFKNEKQ